MLLKNQDDNSFTFQYGDVHTSVIFPYCNTIEYDLNNFRLHILFHPNIPESEIKEVHFKKKRIGWIFPINALEEDNDIIANENSKKYLIKHMEIGLYKAYEQYESEIKKLLDTSDDKRKTIKLSSVLGENALFFVESLETSETLNFKFNNIYPILVIKHSLLKFDEKRICSALSLGTNLTLESISDDLISDDFINTIFIDLFSLPSTHELLRFHILYQVIEHLMERIYYPLLKKLVNENQSPHDLKNKLNKLSQQKERIKILLTTNCTIRGETQTDMSTIYHKITSICLPSTDLVNEDTDEKDKGIHDQIYFLRNLLFHNFRVVVEKNLSNSDFSMLNNTFEKLIIDILLTFTLPSTS